MNKVKKVQEIKSSATIGKRIQYLRTNKGIKQEELADKLGITRYLLIKYEDDKASVPTTLLEQLSKELDTSINYLLGLAESKSSNITIQDISKITGLDDESIEVMAEIKKFKPTTIKVLNYLIKQEKMFPISDFSVITNDNNIKQATEEAEKNYNKAEDLWDELHLSILSTIAKFLDIQLTDEKIYIDKNNNIKFEDDLETKFQRGVNTRAELSLKELADAKLLQDIEYKLRVSKENRIKGTSEKEKQLEKCLKNCNSIKIIKVKSK